MLIVATSSSESSGASMMLASLGTLVLEHLGLGVGGGVAGHVELHADLVERERGQPTGDERTGLPVQHVHVLLERVTRRHRDRVPEVVAVVALVVVADAGVRVDHRGGLVDAVGVDLRGDERRSVAERPRVEDRRELAQHAQLLDVRNRGTGVGLAEAETLAEHCVRTRVEGEVPLHRVQQLTIEVDQLVVGLGHPTMIARREYIGHIVRGPDGRPSQAARTFWQISAPAWVSARSRLGVEPGPSSTSGPYSVATAGSAVPSVTTVRWVRPLRWNTTSSESVGPPAPGLRDEVGHPVDRRVTGADDDVAGLQRRVGLGGRAVLGHVADERAARAALRGRGRATRRARRG